MIPVKKKDSSLCSILLSFIPILYIGEIIRIKIPFFFDIIVLTNERDINICDNLSAISKVYANNNFFVWLLRKFVFRKFIADGKLPLPNYSLDSTTEPLFTQNRTVLQSLTDGDINSLRLDASVINLNRVLSSKYINEYLGPRADRKNIIAMVQAYIANKVSDTEIDLLCNGDPNLKHPLVVINKPEDVQKAIEKRHTLFAEKPIAPVVPRVIRKDAVGSLFYLGGLLYCPANKSCLILYNIGKVAKESQDVSRCFRGGKLEGQCPFYTYVIKRIVEMDNSEAKGSTDV